MQAGALFAAGHTQAEVAHQPGVARQNVSRWHARWQAGGLQALASRGPTGPDPRLSPATATIDQALRQGARTHGFDTDHWTLERITVIQRLTGVAYHRGHTWKLLRAWAGGCGALPAAPSSATSRPLPAGWPRTGPRICRNARRRRAVIVFWDESGASLLPVTRRTWAPRGLTPVICHRFNWKR